MKLLPLLMESMNIFDVIDIENNTITIHHDKMEKLVRSYLPTEYLDISIDSEKVGTFLHSKSIYIMYIWFDNNIKQELIDRLKNNLMISHTDSDDMLLMSVPQIIINVLDTGYENNGITVYFDPDYEYDIIFIGF